MRTWTVFLPVPLAGEIVISLPTGIRRRLSPTVRVTLSYKYLKIPWAAGSLTLLILHLGENKLRPRLKKWLVADGKLCRDPDSLLVSFGDDESFFAMDKDGFCWEGLPSLLEEVLQESIGLEGWKAAPKLVVLGARGSYVYVNSKGAGHSHLGSSYARLKTYLNQPDGLHGKIEVTEF